MTSPPALLECWWEQCLPNATVASSQADTDIVVIMDADTPRVFTGGQR